MEPGEPDILRHLRARLLLTKVLAWAADQQISRAARGRPLEGAGTKQCERICFNDAEPAVATRL